jgi:hypothetical protein
VGINAFCALESSQINGSILVLILTRRSLLPRVHGIPLCRYEAGTNGATLGSPPTDFLGKKFGFVVLARAHELFSFPVSGLIASVKKIKERPDEIKRVIKAGIKSNRYSFRIVREQFGHDRVDEDRQRDGHGYL